MKVCIKCGAQFTHPDWSCPVCGFVPTCSNGVRVLVPEGHAAPAGYDAAFFSPLAKMEESSFWFRARTRVITWAIGKYFPSSRNYLEVGAGTGCVLAGVAAAFPDLELHASEPFKEGLVFARQRVAKAVFMQMDANDIPFVDEFDLIGAFDVLEHIGDDESVLGQIHRAIAPGGGILLTVPQHEFLWSQQDEAAGHQRRYSAKNLRKKVECAGFRVCRMTSFVSLLLPAMLGSRLLKMRRQADFDPLDELRVGARLGSAMESVMNIELAIIRAGMSLPLGGSLLLVGKKL